MTNNNFISDNNSDVHALWIGHHLSAIELLCVNSFINNGHKFHLWLYDKINQQLPNHIIIEDANAIIPCKEVFCYKYPNQFGHGKGSYAGFSDIFRYKLLYLKGGWWTDMDVVCLKPFNFVDAYVFRSHHDFPAIGNIMKCPKDSQLMYDCYNEALQLVDENNTDWDLPIKILNKNIQKQTLSNFIRTFSNPDDWNYVKKLFVKNIKIPESWIAVHLVNEELRKNKIHKNAILKQSFIGLQVKKHLEKLNEGSNLWHRFQNYYRTSLPNYWLNSDSIGLKIKHLFNNTIWLSAKFVKKNFFKNNNN